MKNSDTIEESNNLHDQYINGRMEELKGLLRKLAESFIKFLFAAHSGGILAVAGIIKIHEQGLNLYTKAALTCFVVGLLVNAFLVLKMLFRIYAVDKAWHKDIDAWHEGEICWGELNARDVARTEKDKLEFLLALGSFFIFFTGAIFGVITIWLYG